ncbi:MAG: hypothetical protein ACI4EV_09660 [Lachnospiraceae bacterium]
MENIIEWLENIFWIILIVTAVTFIIYQTGIIDRLAEIIAKIIFQDYVLNFV